MAHGFSMAQALRETLKDFPIFFPFLMIFPWLKPFHQSRKQGRVYGLPPLQGRKVREKATCSTAQYLSITS